MEKLIQRITVYKIIQGVTDEDRIKKVAVVDGVDKAAERDLGKLVWKCFEYPANNKVVLRRSWIGEDEAT